MKPKPPTLRATAKLADERVMRGMTQRDLAERMKADPSWVSQIESGYPLGPRGAAKLARALGMSVRRLVDDGVLERAIA